MPVQSSHKTINPSSTRWKSKRSSEDEEEKCPSSQANGNHESFLEAESKRGADKIRQLSVEERTKRAMLAEAVEDRMDTMIEDLELLLGENGMPKSEENRDEVEALARQIKASREQYRGLVNGEPSSLIDGFNGLSE
eukprot:CAMPEP_0184866282 /NCGR_PEP_ID=MMETSP0580-20130426/21692_1 /TAXON_ID=1118495 /ORGANISM="Dactyliosolen fragilissimus" /LENGTH=136 /DNA_ID=CAMNT_0027365893 /DNA_START=172 /DNA_END=582 /DNA_ORIENTATION=+